MAGRGVVERDFEAAEELDSKDAVLVSLGGCSPEDWTTGASAGGSVWDTAAFDDRECEKRAANLELSDEGGALLGTGSGGGAPMSEGSEGRLAHFIVSMP